ncbi:alpha-galactosidase [Xylanibacter ruminicola]|uniref:Alpha-galactosidase n=2 Tax=Xylanibacter ruminicola TaxID=839 RepID=D5EWN6_XYLR2|nr:alpha-galactosidase [Xylanibacter ruminicola]ADE81486.1 putative alpha-galactosidase [Xylanibacter ruminicola 23]SEH86431.1 alpha-galactosidase [Xylanibacter ruminicola]
MKKILFLAFLMVSASTAWAKQVVIQTKNTTMVLDVETGKQPQYVYYGAKLSDYDLQNLQSPRDGRMDAYPAYGMNCPAEAAVAMTHADGNMSTELFATDVTTQGSVTQITLKDPKYPVQVVLCYQARFDEDMIETWTEIKNGEAKPITLTQFASCSLPIRRGNVWLSHFGGSWGNEARLIEEPIQLGQKVIKNKDGVRNAHTDHAEVMFSLDGKGRENSGDVIGAALCYSGNYQLKVETDDTEYHYFFAGINPDNSAYHLKKGETFTTPKVAFSFSKCGLSGVSRNFHKWGRKYMLAHGNKERKILLNSWEGVYFDINQQGMDQMMGDIASMGGELFVMDDGWFGVKYPRKTDNCALGDWEVDKNKLPEGIEGLLRDAKKHGIKFGIWIEPEMTNSVSELYDAHPDWVVKAPKRDVVKGRGGTQLVLDLANPKVQDFVFSIVDNLMTKYPEIDYIKWDANMAIMNHGSQYLTMNDQSHLYIEYHRGFEKVCQRVRAKYPNLTIQACASGGGRANWGVLPYFDEFWVSDNTDALQRIYMQWGTSYFFPAIAMASHISATPNHTVFRTTALKYRVDVAMSGRLGMEIQPKNMTDDEKELCRKAIAEYKQIRPIVQFGDIYRLVSPYDKQGLASLMYVDEQKSKSVFFWWKTESFQNEHLPRVKMAGLDASKNYKIHELNRIDLRPMDVEGKVFSGAYLMNHGLEMPYRNEPEWSKKNDWSSRVLLLEAQ